MKRLFLVLTIVGIIALILIIVLVTRGKKSPYSCHTWTPSELQQIQQFQQQGFSAVDAQSRVCNAVPGQIFTAGANGNSAYPGCSAMCWCCKKN